MLRSVDPKNIEVIDDQLAEILRTKTPAERVEMIAAANRTARLLAAAGIRCQHPDWDEAQIQAEVIRRVTGGTD
jgi:Xaa-Pro aminopeptidase